MTHLKHGEEEVTDTPEVENQLSFSSSPWESRYDRHIGTKAYIVSGDTSFPTAQNTPESTEVPKLWVTPDLE